MFETVFGFGCGSTEDLGSFDGPMAVLHVLGKARVCPFACFSCFHVFLVACVEAPGCFTDVGFVAGGAGVFVHAFVAHGVSLGLVL